MSSPDGCGMFTCLSFFVAGVVFVALLEVVLGLYLIRRLLNTTLSESASSVRSDLKIKKSGESSISLQGDAWVAPIPENLDLSKVVVKQIRKDKKKERECGQKEKDMLEIAPVRRYAVLKDKWLSLRAPDGTDEEVSVEGCVILTVSSSSPGESRKWGKKFPIKLHHPNRRLYRGSQTFLFYAQSGYAKEAWCEAFRAMAATNSSLCDFTCGTKRKYLEYTRAAEENMPYLTKFFAVGEEDKRKEVKPKEERPEGPSKRRTMWRKLARKGSVGMDQKETRFAHAVDEAFRRKQPRNIDETAWKSRETAFYDDVSEGSAHDSVTPVVDPNFDRDKSFDRLANGEASNTSSASSYRESGDERDPRKSKEGKEIEQGVLCLNMIVARLYYDFNQSERRLAGINRFFQRLISKIRKPSYVKSISIKELDLGRHPPFATAVRILPSDAVGALAMELDLEWLGGGHLTCETRLDLRDQSTQGEVAAQLAESGSEGDATAAVLSGLRGEFDEASSASFSVAMQEGRQADLPNKKGRWMQSVKTMLSRVAEQVSQVPLALKIRLVSIKGTAVLRLKAPPSDRVWFAFKTMPDIHFEPEPCIGDHRISSGALARLIANQIKIQIRESVVLPYCEDFFLSWMLADKRNWLPHETFPFPFFDSSERETFKKFAESYSSSSDESVKRRPRPQNIRNAQTKPPKGQAFRSALPVAFKSQKPVLAQASTSAQVSNHDVVHPRRTSSELLLRLSGRKPPKSAGTDRLNAQSSVPSSLGVRPSALMSNPVEAFGPTALSVMSPLLSKESKTEFMRPLLTAQESQNEEWESARDIDLGTVRTAMDTRPKEGASQSDGSASESDVQFLDTQVANPNDVRELDHNSRLTGRGRMASVGKKMHNVVEKFHHKRPDDMKGST